MERLNKTMIKLHKKEVETIRESTKRMKERNTEMKNKTIAAAREVIEEEGIDELSMRKVAEKMGYTTQVVYHYFDSKKELIKACAQAGYDELMLIARENRLIGRQHSDYLKFTNDMKKLIMQARKNRSDFITAIRNLEDDQSYIVNFKTEENSETYRRIFQDVDKMFWDKTGEFRKNNRQWPEGMLCNHIWMALFGMYFMLVMNKDLTDLDVNLCVDRHMEIILYGIFDRETPHDTLRDLYEL